MGLQLQGSSCWLCGLGPFCPLNPASPHVDRKRGLPTGSCSHQPRERGGAARGPDFRFRPAPRRPSGTPMPVRHPGPAPFPHSAPCPGRGPAHVCGPAAPPLPVPGGRPCAGPHPPGGPGRGCRSLPDTARNRPALRSARPAPHLSTSALWLGLVTAAMYCMMCLLASVFPAPLSPARQPHRQDGRPGPGRAPAPAATSRRGRRRGPGVPEITTQVSLALRFIAL